ncbi:PucR family transcriptional regulator [Raoultibacter phocaeensis]|uniref:PucR family transcriptional regulator n=1 Tax=Raoultibacter phocaeensis TaxID=2479841 RepID=UPI0015D57506|nr:helix-turn-helix domain-containing protein [Raoultibacter phocaeensis]
MSCNEMPLTDGLVDLFSILEKRIMPLCENLWRARMRLDMPHYFFFTKMLEHASVTDEYVRNQMELIGLDSSTEYKLIALEVDGDTEPDRAALAIRAASGLNQGNVFCFPHQNMTLALCHTPPSDSLLSHVKTIQELRERMYEPLGIVSGVSEVFTDITNLDLAFQQTKIALGLKQTIASEQFASDQEMPKGIYLFGDALMYYLVDPSDKDERFMRFCFSHTILKKIYEDDQQNGTNCLALFWFYLYYGRNATAVAQRLHMHRNTVLYHIEKIQKRFDFDLSWRTARDRMMLDFKVFFLTVSHESIEKIFADAES